MSDYIKKIHIIGGGTFSHIRNHLSLAAPAFGQTANWLDEIFYDAIFFDKNVGNMEVVTTLTKMANSDSDIVTNDDVANWVDEVVAKDISYARLIFNAQGPVNSFEISKVSLTFHMQCSYSTPRC